MKNIFIQFIYALKSFSTNIKFLMLFFILTFTNIINASSQGFYDIDTIQKIEISFAQSNWDYILDTAKQGSDSYTMALEVKINGQSFDSVGVKFKGNSSYNANNAKNPFHIELDHFKNQDYMGFKDIKLSNGFKDPSLIREALSYNILRKYMKASLSNFAQLYINGQYIGIYTNTEVINKTFVDSHFYSNNNSFFFMDNFGGNLTYLGPDSTLYYSKYTMKSNYGWADLVNLCNILKIDIPGIENILDVDRTLWMLAFDNVLVNLDSYIGQPQHNYYIYEDHNGRFNPIVWDVNEAFGNFTNSGSGNLSISQEQTMTPWLHLNDIPWPIINKLFTNPMYKRMYIAHMKTIVNENFANNDYLTMAPSLQAIIDTAVQSDNNKFYSYQQFHDNITNNVTSGPQTIVGLSVLMAPRTNYLNSTTDFQQIAPTISNIQVSDSLPLVYSSIYITANVINTSNVYLGIRNSVMEKFTKLIMLDDGVHGDGAAGDGTFGISVPVSSTEIQYYIYAENNNAGIFSPERAENEYYTIVANYASITAGQVVINEIMANNNSTILNNNGIYGDWIELYNTSSNTVVLDFLNLSDDATNTAKWQFPSGTSIPPNGFLIVWADNDTSSTELHCNFKFSANGENAVLAYSASNIIDSISFPIQTADITWGRYPNGTGPFVLMPPTFNTVNSSYGIEETVNSYNNVHIFPNPTDKSTTIKIYNSKLIESELSIYDILGNLVFEKGLTSNLETIYFDLPNGIYLYKVINDYTIIGNGKIIVQRK